MTAATSPVRRSPLETVHARIGAGWPMSYGNPEAERRAVTEAVGLAEPGLYDKWLLRGAGAAAAIRAAGLEARPGSVTPAPVGGINVWTVAEDEAWLVGYAPTPGGPPATAIDPTPILERARRDGVHVTNLSSGWSVLRLFGPRVRDLLEELVTINLAPAALPDLAIAQVPLAGCRAVLSRRDSEGIAGFTMLVGRDEAAYLWETLVHLGEPHGLRPVGAAALLTPAAAGAAR